MSGISYTPGRGQVVLKAFEWDRKSPSSGTLERWHLKGTWWRERSWRLSRRWWDTRPIYNDWYRGAWMPEDKVKRALNWSDVNEWSITRRVIDVVRHQAPSVPKRMKSGGRPIAVLWAVSSYVGWTWSLVRMALPSLKRWCNSLSYRRMPTFGSDSVRKFSANVSELKGLAAHNFENIF